jgi:hypothetical protein
MKLIESSVQIIEEKDPYKMIELAGRTCYKSENNITEDSALVMTGFESDWEGFFRLRCSKAAHPDAQKLANELKELLINVKNN